MDFCSDQLRAIESVLMWMVAPTAAEMVDLMACCLDQEKETESGLVLLAASMEKGLDFLLAMK